MSIAEPNRVVPKSVLRHRPLASEKVLAFSSWNISTPRASRKLSEKREEQTTSSPGTATQKGLLLQTKRVHSWPWAVLVGLTVTGTILLLLLLQVTWSWGTEIYNNLHYGMPRTTQVDAYVGQETGKTPSHFIAENLKGRVLIIDFPGGDVHHTQVIVGPQVAGPDADQVPVQLSFVDRSGSHFPDMLVRFGSMEVWYINEHGTFVPQ